MVMPNKKQVLSNKIFSVALFGKTCFLFGMSTKTVQKQFCQTKKKFHQTILFLTLISSIFEM